MRLHEGEGVNAKDRQLYGPAPSIFPTRETRVGEVPCCPLGDTVAARRASTPEEPDRFRPSTPYASIV